MKTAEERFFEYCMKQSTCNGCRYETFCFPELRKEKDEFKEEGIKGRIRISKPIERKRI